jgi:glycosyltransferase involved in cell wall biosynthesis
MQDITPIISVVIPVLNRPDELRVAIQSVLAQTMQDLEIIVVDDGSTDDTQTIAVAQKYSAQHPEKIRFIQHPHNQGVSAARNTGIAAARGEFIALLDSDDTWYPDKLRQQLVTLKAAPDVQNTICICDYLWVDKSDNSKTMLFEPSMRDDLTMRILFGAINNMGTTMIAHRDTFKNTGVFDETMNVAEDIDWLIRHVMRGGACVTPSGILSVYNAEPEKNYPRHTEQLQKIYAAHGKAILQKCGFNAYRTFIAGIHSHYLYASRRKKNGVTSAYHWMMSVIIPPHFFKKLFRYIQKRI